jgi:hypothetical protein
VKSFLFSLVVISALACAGLLPPQAAAALDLPAGDELAGFAWQSDQQMILLVRSGENYALRRLELATGDLAVIPAPLSFTNIKAESPGSRPPVFALAQSGTALAVLERYESPLQPPDLSVYRIAEDGLEPAGTSAVPADFWPAHLAWSTDGETLYLSAQRFLFPEQAYSIAKFELRSERFAALALKANIDLITTLEFIPQRSALLAVCNGFQGEYPDQPMIALVQLTGRAQLLHSQAANHWVNVLDEGSVLIGAAAEGGRDELWLLARNATQLVPAQCAFPESAPSLQTSRDGSWMGFVISDEQLDQPARAGEDYLVLQRTNDGKTVVTADACSAFAFSPAGDQVCAVNMDGSAVQFYSLAD